MHNEESERRTPICEIKRRNMGSQSKDRFDGKCFFDKNLVLVNFQCRQRRGEKCVCEDRNVLVERGGEAPQIGEGRLDQVRP